MENVTQQIKCFSFGPFQTNTYAIQVGSTMWLIDPACWDEYEKQILLNYLQDKTFEDLKIIATHGHLDHLWGAGWACQTWQSSVLIHEADQLMAERMQDQYDLFGIRRKAEPFPVEVLPIEQQKVGPFAILHTAGHTPGSICLYWSEEKLLFSGDTLFRMGYGRTDLPGGNYKQLLDSLERLMNLPSDTEVYPGHGDSTTIGAEKRFY